MTTLLKLWNPRLEWLKKGNANNKTNKNLSAHDKFENSSPYE